MHMVAEFCHRDIDAHMAPSLSPIGLIRLFCRRPVTLFLEVFKPVLPTEVFAILATFSHGINLKALSAFIVMVHGGLTVACFLLKNLSDDQLRALQILQELENRVLECHENVEFRVRIAAGHLMGLLCFRSGLVTFKRFLPSVIEGITTNLERSPDAPATESESSLRELIIAKERDVNMSRSSLSVFHDTAGWKNLETWMKCLQEMVVSLKPEDFVQIDRSQILDLVFKATDHVRMAASRAVRTFFEVPPPPEHSWTDVYPILLPAMCLNRYYVAEGVRLYSQETWCRVTKGEGKKLTEIYVDAVVDYYTQQATADNHTLREVSCTSISEIVSKLSPDLMRPHILKLLTALLICFDGTSWSTRDAACAALGTLVSKFPEETKAAGYKNLLADQFLRNLSDIIPSVRETAAYSIANILRSVSDPELIQLYRKHIDTQLANIRDQPADSHGVEPTRSQTPGLSWCVISRSGADAHDARHTDQTMYSCGSLAPTGFKAIERPVGLNQRPTEPWEHADGALRLIGQIAECSPQIFTDDLVYKMLTACEYKHYTHYPYLLDTACNVVIQLYKGLEKTRFKRHLDNLLILLTTAFESQLPLAVLACKETLEFLSTHVGPNVIRGRVENHLDDRVPRALSGLLPSAA
ncbi:hypothetical protein T265_11497 [Opisthorchis viverrini]|uniref:HEAT repeat protein n=1 Tax=Opisthorchis viverrini TaxID=6198 RepID=A0A074YYF5_OPIVI|nr:hypothetical protein T265_11497 [Opisthorchis viverrini]KER19831.1 hypothetical protein T265_11497 [Opisthorchis viverrini]